MSFTANNKCFFDFFFLFFLIIFTIPLQLQAINFHLFYYYDYIFIFQKLIFVIILTIFFSVLLNKIHSKIDYLLNFFFLWLIFIGLFLPISGTFDLLIKQKININLFVINTVKILILIYFSFKIKKIPNFLSFLKIFIFIYTFIILSNIMINQNKYSFKNFNEIFDFSKKENLVVLSFDGVSNDRFLNALLNSEEKKYFKDFTFYQNVHSNANGTWISTNLEIFGHLPFSEKISSQNKHLSQMYTHSQKFKIDKKIKLDVYGSYNRNFRGEINRYNYSILETSKLKSFYYYFKEVTIPSLNRYLSPYFSKIKSYFFSTNLLSKIQKQNELYSLNNETHNDFVKLIDNIKVNNQTEYKSVKFFHFEFSHSPIEFDKNCNNRIHDKKWELIQLKLKDIEISKCIIMMNKNFIKNLKEKNLYENSTIIIKSDHGRRKDYYSNPPNNITINNNRYFSYGRYRPILLIKNKNQTRNELKISNDQIFLSDLNQLYCKNKIVKCSKSNGYNFFEGKFLETKPVEVFIPLEEKSYVNINENKKILFERSNKFYEFLYELR